MKQPLSELGLVDIMRVLMRSEINSGLQFVYDGQLTVWLGDPMNGNKIELTFDVGANDPMHLMPRTWLATVAKDYYPHAKLWEHYE